MVGRMPVAYRDTTRSSTKQTKRLGVLKGTTGLYIHSWVLPETYTQPLRLLKHFLRLTWRRGALKRG
jgi:hypothetical protein